MDILENSTMLIAIAGDGRSYSLMAIDEAQKGNFEKADEYLKKADESLVEGHKYQSELLRAEAKDEKLEISILLIHAQDHLMNAMTIYDLAKLLVPFYKKTLQ